MLYDHIGERDSILKKEKLTMTKSVMLGEISVRELHGPWSDFMDKLQGENGREWFGEFKRFLRKEPCWVGNAVAKPLSQILEFVGTVTIPATIGKFVAKEKFVVNIKQNAPVKIIYLGANFTAWFLSGDGKIEDTISEQTLRYHKLRESSVDGQIITELGGEAKVETTLSEMFSLMVGQKHGKDDVQLRNRWSNIFYIKGQNGVLRAVNVLWGDGGWYVDACLVGFPSIWVDGSQVFTRNSVL